MQKHVNNVDLVKSFPKSIYYLLAKFGFDTAEKEPSKVGRDPVSPDCNRDSVRYPQPPSKCQFESAVPC